MIKIKNIVTPSADQWKAIIMGARNPMNSWDRSDSMRCGTCGDCDICVDYECCPFEHDGHKLIIGPNDHKLTMSLAKGGPVHAKYRRMIVVYADITAPLYWWKEFDVYRVGVEKNSCSTMHKIHAKEFTREDFSCDHLFDDKDQLMDDIEEVGKKDEIRGWLNSPLDDLDYDIEKLNLYRKMYLQTNNKVWWWQMIQRLPSSYNQKRTVMVSYETLANMYESRKNHKLDEWREFCSWVESLPYSELIIGEAEDE